MKTVEYLDALLKKLELTSDYQLSKALGLTRSAVSLYRTQGGTFNNDTAKTVGKLLGIHPLRVIADMERERAKTPEDRELWRELAAKIVGVLVAAGAGALLTIAGPKPAYAAAGGFHISFSSDAIRSPSSGPLYALHAIRRAARRLLASVSSLVLCRRFAQFRTAG